MLLLERSCSRVLLGLPWRFFALQLDLQGHELVLGTQRYFQLPRGLQVTLRRIAGLGQAGQLVRLQA
ncbi:hypothetical protein D3C87_1749430 [compost metagenome]